MKDNIDRKERIATILRDSRAATHISQEQIAAAIGVNRKTISKWENGQSMPDIYQLTEWFRILGVPFLPYIYSYLYPNLNEQVNMDDEKYRSHLHDIIDTLHMDDVKGIFYILHGNHGSVPHSLIQMTLAHLHCPMDYRVSHAKNILGHYELCQLKNTLVNCDEFLPELNNLNDAISEGFKAAVDNKQGYTSKQEE